VRRPPLWHVRFFVVFGINMAIVLTFTGCQTVPANRDAMLSRARVAEQDGLPVVHLSGTPYEIGYQHGTLLRQQVRDHYQQLYGYMQSLPKFRFCRRFQVNFILNWFWDDLEPYVPKEFLEEMRGLADGSGVPLADIYRAHAIPDIHSTACSVGAFWGAATADGRMVGFRNLDWNRRMGVHNHGCVFVISPEGRHSFANIGFVGFIGALSGMNDRGIFIGQIGSSSADESYDGTSFTWLLRQILERAGNVDEAARIVRDSRRTKGINYVIGSSIEKRAVAMETTAHHFAKFYDADKAEAESPYAVLVTNAVFRSDTAFDPTIRELQTCSEGDPKKPGLEDPRGCSAHDKRYLKQAEMVRDNYGKITTNEVFALARRIAAKSNIQSVVYAYPEFWVAYGRNDARAADCAYHHFNLEQLLSGKQ
jgi:hypothetical protein